MAPSQLKQLKASLREHGIRGPQKSKKERQATGKDAQKRSQRHAALESIRERFNAFEVKGPKREKFEVASGRKLQASSVRPGVTRGLGEERRRETLLKEMQSRNKVGGLLDRRFGENDPSMTPEQRAAERFARQNERKLRKTSMFNLEDDSEEEMTLTHGGRSLEFGGNTQDDFDEGDVAASDEDVEDFEGQNDRPRKKLRLEDSLNDGSEEDDDMPERKKTKNEVMKEIIAKSKMYKAERQAAKADDDDLRAELDKGMSDFYQALREHKVPEKQQATTQATEAEPHMDPARAAMLAGKSRADAEKEYEANLRELKLEARSKPSVRTKTDEEKAAEEAARLEELERKRVRRMKGEAESSEDEDDAELGPDEDFEEDDAEAFGLAAPEAAPRKDLDVEDEDEFVLDDDLVASDSEAEMASDQDEDEDESEEEPEDDGDDDFINGLVLPKQPKSKTDPTEKVAISNNLAYTFPCPQTHDEFLEVTKDAEFTDLPTIVQRIRALYHKGLAQGNQEKLDVFAGVLSQHVAWLADNKNDVPFSVLESLLRHLHSMAKASPQAVGVAFRAHLESIAEERAFKLSPGDLIILTGVSTIFPTSDHFHAVVTPAMLTLGRYLGQSTIQNIQDLGTGAYCCSLSLRYQRLAKRHIPEVVTYIVNALAALAPVPLPEKDKDGRPLNIPARLPRAPLRISSNADAPEKLAFKELVMDAEAQDDSSKRTALLNAFIRICAQSAELWKHKTAFPELISPCIQALVHIVSHPSKLHKQSIALASTTLQNLKSLQTAAIEARKPLLLHNHRPLAIKSSIPAFIENYNPDRHYDPDRQRAELSKLKAEHKKERKGAMRELRKDANFMAREQLREKKEKDAAYDKKFKRLVAEIQGEEGREQKDYDREKKKRQGRF
ncbi:nucleolar complex protein 14 [Rhinocladiella similis]